MKVAVNGISAKSGGTLVVLRELVRDMARVNPEDEYHVVINSSVSRELFSESGNIRYYQFPIVDRTSLIELLWFVLILPIWMKRKGIDVLFSLNSYLPLLRPRRTVLLMQDRCFFHEPLEIRDRMSLTESIVFRFKRAWAFYSMRVADSITVQTKAMADSVMAQIPAAASKLSVIHHGPGIFNRSERAKTVDVSTCLEVAYVAYYRKYKNFPVLFRALKELRERSVPVRLHLTLNPNDRSVRSMLDDAKALGVADLTINHGELSEESVAELYHGVHVFAFPSICESFGLPQVEAMTFGLPVVAADTEVNREICAAAGSYFKADDYKALADRLEQFYRNPVQLAEASKRSIRRGSEFCWKYAAVELSRLLVKEP